MLSILHVVSQINSCKVKYIHDNYIKLASKKSKSYRALGTTRTIKTVEYTQEKMK